MSQKEKLISKLKESPKSFTFDDAESLLGCFGYYRSNKGRTGGSRVMFFHVASDFLYRRVSYEQYHAI